MRPGSVSFLVFEGTRAATQLHGCCLVEGLGDGGAAGWGEMLPFQMCWTLAHGCQRVPVDAPETQTPDRQMQQARGFIERLRKRALRLRGGRAPRLAITGIF